MIKDKNYKIERRKINGEFKEVLVCDEGVFNTIQELKTYRKAKEEFNKKIEKLKRDVLRLDLSKFVDLGVDIFYEKFNKEINKIFGEEK